MEGVPPVFMTIGSARRRRRIPAPDNDDLDAPAPPRASPPSYPRMTHPWLMSVTAAGMADTDLGTALASDRQS